ncbi:MAG: hypothetical protein ACLPXZ_01735, partial [Mycobacterium sp.]
AEPASVGGATNYWLHQIWIYHVATTTWELVAQVTNPPQPSTSGANVKALGALGNGKIVFDGALTTGCVLTSATANFASADVGKLACVQHGSTASCVKGGSSTATCATLCGTITTFTNSNNVTITPEGSEACTTTSSAEVHYASNDTAAFQSAITALSGAAGGLITVQPGIYGLNAQLHIPTNAAIIIQGAGAAWSNWYFAQAQNNPNRGSSLNLLTKLLTSPFILVGNGQSNTTTKTWQAHGAIRDVSIEGCAGPPSYNGSVGDCGASSAADGLDVVGYGPFKLSESYIDNFAGKGFYYDSPPGGYPPITAPQQMVVDQSYIAWNGNAGIQLGGNAPGSIELENVALRDSLIENNGLAGVQVDVGGGNAGTPITYAAGQAYMQNLEISDCMIQDNDTSDTSTIFNLQIQTGCSGACSAIDHGSLKLTANYWQAGNGGYSYGAVTDQIASFGVRTDSDYIQGGTISLGEVTVSQLPSCDTGWNQRSGCVTDATACTVNGSLTGSGSTVCRVTCRSSTWYETGTSDGC